MKMLRSILAVAVVTLIASHVSFAQLEPVPEIDLGMGAGMLAFLGGAVMVIRGRRKA